MDKAAAYTPKQLYETLISILNNVQLSEIAVSPYILPEEEEPSNHTEASTSASQLSFKQILSHSIRPFSLIEGDKLVIPQKPLYALYGYAVKMLSTYPLNVLQFATSDPSEITEKMGDSAGPVELDQIDDIAKCILIQTPEHGRAMNLRKRILLYKLLQSTTTSTTTGEKSRMIQRELNLTELILGTAANAKMGPLWHHRKWLFALQYSMSSPREYPNTSLRLPNLLDQHMQGRKVLRIEPVSLSTSEFEHELKLVNACAERYPRNYQAWAYRNWLIRGQVIEALTSSGKPSQGEERVSTILEEEYQDLEKHLSTHITDHTAANHLLNVISLSFREDTSGRSLLDRCWNFAVDFVVRYPYKETPWLLLRGVLALYKEQQESRAGATPNTHQRRLQDALSTTRDVLESRKNQQAGSGHDLRKYIEDWEDQQTSSSIKYATRSYFYLSCKGELSGQFLLSSDEGRGILEKFR